METPSIRVLPCWGILKYNKFNSIQFKLERRRVFNKTLLDAGVESSRELSEGSGLCKAPDETKKRLK